MRVRGNTLEEAGAPAVSDAPGQSAAGISPHDAEKKNRARREQLRSSGRCLHRPPNTAVRRKRMGHVIREIESVDGCCNYKDNSLE